MGKSALHSKCSSWKYHDFSSYSVHWLSTIKSSSHFKILNCASISLPTFFRHQSSYLLPAVSSVWIRHQERLLSKFKESKVNLQVGGDGRADSPGHCAKYGTYLLIELTCNKVVDFQLVQVCMILQTFVLILFQCSYILLFFFQ